MIRRIQAHVSRCFRRVQILDDTISIGGVLMNDGQRSVRTRSKDVASRRIEGRAIDARADRQRCNGLAGIVVGHGEHAAPAAAEQPMVGRAPSATLVISLPACGSMTVAECASPLKLKTRFDAPS